MKNFNREAIQRMFDGRKGGGGGGTNNADLAGYATQMWVNQNYVSIEFFNRLFSIHGHDPEDDSTPPTDISVLPNDMDSIVDSIESMVGFWTEEYLSALGQNDDQGGGGITLNAALASINNSPLGNPTGTSTVLMFNGTTWVYASMGSTDMNTVWNALAAATNQQINISHLTTALSGYATTSQLSDYATVTDLEQLASYFNTLSGYFTNGAANEAVKLETARTIWGQQFDGTANITGDITQATCLEFSGIAGTATNGGFIDFHYAGGGADYTSRIIEDVSGVLKINNTIWAQLSGNVSIGTPTISQTYKLDIAGYTKTTRLYLSDGVYLEYDSTNSGVHLVGAGFYSDSYVSALGVNSGGGGGTDYIPLTGSDQIAGSLIPVTTNAYDLGDSTHAWRNIRGNSIYASNSITTYYLTANSTVTSVGSITSTAGNIIASAGYVSAAAGFKVSSLDSQVAGSYVILADGTTTKLKTVNGFSLFGEGNIDASGGGTGNYLPLTGGTLTNSSFASQLTIERSVYPYDSVIKFKNSTGVLGCLGYDGDNKRPCVWLGNSGTGTPIWHEGNLNPSKYAYIGLEGVVITSNSDLNNIVTANTYYCTGGSIAATLSNTPYTSGNFKLWHIVNTGNDASSIYQYSAQLMLAPNVARWFTRSHDNNTFGTWKEFAFLSDLASYLPLSGGTLSNSAWRSQLTIKRSGSNYDSVIAFENNSGLLGCLGFIGETGEAAVWITTSGQGSKIWHAGNFTPSDYLPLAGGTMEGDIKFHYDTDTSRTRGFRFLNTSNSAIAYILYHNTEQNIILNPLGSANVYADVVGNYSLFVGNHKLTYNTYTIWTAGNDGTGSGLDADLLDGQHGSYYAAASSLNDYLSKSGGTMTGDITMSNDKSIILSTGTGWDDAYRGIPFSSSSDIKKITYVYSNFVYNPNTNRLKTGGLTLTSGNLILDGQNASSSTSGITQIVFGNNGTEHVALSSNNGYLVINPSTTSTNGQISLGTGSYNTFFASTGNFGIGHSNPQYKLHVNGTVGIADTITLIGGTAAKQRIYFDSTHYIELDSNGYFHFSHGVYSDGFVSALGLNSGGGSAVDYIPLSGSTSITGDLTPSNNNSVNLGSSSKLWAGVYCTNLRAYGASSIAGNLSLAGSITPTTDQQYSLGTESLRFAGLFVHGRIYLSGMNIQYLSSGSGVLGGYHFQAGSSDIILETSGYVWQRTTSQYYSDIRRKNIVSYIDTPVDKIANAPIFTFTWKDFTGNMQQGSSAQYWRDVLPNGVAEASNGTLGMDYATTALISAVITARKVVDHEARIRLLEVENAALRNEINQLKKVA